ncbi:MAG: urea transporter, partial [Gammaproteobacteria bacterium]|nr:urea transporter [Gammaproteobacteria bacterium]
MNLKQLTAIPNAYSAVMFIKHPAAGITILIVTLWHPNIGLSGLLATLTGLMVLHLLQFSNDTSGIHTLNSLLVGLSLGAFFQLNIYLVVLIILSAVMVTFLSITLADSFWRLGRIPMFSLPFLIIALLVSLIARNTDKLAGYMSLNSRSEQWFGIWIDTFFNSLGTTFFSPNPLAGFTIFLCILYCSRYLAFLALSGYIVGFSVFIVLIDNPQPHLIAWSGFNFILTAIALGGIYTIPSIASFSFAMLGASLAALLSASIQNILLLYGLPVMALPFVIVTLTLLAAMQKRTRLSPVILASEPGYPELNYERARLARIRQGGLNSVPLLAPFYGTWGIYQGFNGLHTHKQPWQHALDFFILENKKSFNGSGEKLANYYCYNAPVVSPVYGVIVRVINNVTDNPPGEIDTKNNWGNLVSAFFKTVVAFFNLIMQQSFVHFSQGSTLLR